MKVVIFETDPAEQPAYALLPPDHQVLFQDEGLGRLTLAAVQDAQIISTFLSSDLSAAALQQLPDLQVIATRSTGYDHIDMAYCRSAGITVCNVPAYGDQTVAEHTFALLLALSRHIIPAVARTRRGDFSQEGLRGFDLAGKTLGVIGAGRIGRRVIQLGQGFGMDVLAFDLAEEPRRADSLGFQFAPLDEVLKSSDVITIHLPGGPTTTDLISDHQFDLMKPGAVLINTARGGVVNSPALVRALTSGRLAGAGLDVIAEEAAMRDEAALFRIGAQAEDARLRVLLADHALLAFDNVIITPHIAYDTNEAVARIIKTTVANIAAAGAGRPQNVVGV